MSENYIIYQPEETNRLDFNKVHNEISNKWEEKARSLQKRRWRKVRANEKKISGTFFLSRNQRKIYS